VGTGARLDLLGADRYAAALMAKARLVVVATEVDDGTGDGVALIGEPLRIGVVVRNAGHGSPTAVTATGSSADGLTFASTVAVSALAGGASTTVWLDATLAPAHPTARRRSTSPWETSPATWARHGLGRVPMHRRRRRRRPHLGHRLRRQRPGGVREGLLDDRRGFDVVGVDPAVDRSLPTVGALGFLTPRRGTGVPQRAGCRFIRRVVA